MKKVKCYLKSDSPYSQGRYHDTPKLNKELPADYEDRTWRDKLHTNAEGYIVIPPMQFANSLRDAAKYLSIQIPGKGKSTFTKHFDSGIMVETGITLDLHKGKCDSASYFLPSDGQAGGGRRVKKTFPIIHDWEGEVVYTILDDIITIEAFEQIIKASGTLIGIGVWRPRNRGLNGRFSVDIKSFEDFSL